MDTAAVAVLITRLTARTRLPLISTQISCLLLIWECRQCLQAGYRPLPALRATREDLLLRRGVACMIHIGSPINRVLRNISRAISKAVTVITSPMIVAVISTRRLAASMAIISNLSIKASPANMAASTMVMARMSEVATPATVEVGDKEAGIKINHVTAATVINHAAPTATVAIELRCTRRGLELRCLFIHIAHMYYSGICGDLSKQQSFPSFTVPKISSCFWTVQVQGRESTPRPP